MHERVTVKNAAELLSISEHAVRQRINRGTLEHEKAEDGRVYVLLDTEAYVEKSAEQKPDALIEALQDQIQTLKRQLATADERDRENRRLLAAALERIPAIEAPQDTPSEPRESPQTASEEQSGSQAPQEEERRSWWQRLFGA